MNLSPPKNIREVRYKNCSNCKYLDVHDFGIICKRDNAPPCDPIEFEHVVCDGFKWNNTGKE